jgi:hypothetical protein
MPADPITREDIERYAGMPFDRISAIRRIDITRTLERQRGIASAKTHAALAPMGEPQAARLLGMQLAEFRKLLPTRRLEALERAKHLLREEEAKRAKGEQP